MAGLLGDFLSWIDSKKRIAADNLGGLLSHPIDTAQRLGYQAADQLAGFSDAAARGDINATVEGLLNSGLAGPLQTVYHGTPHKFDKYDLSKIGTGEGAQAYGHGIYFAENPDVAGAYQSMLAPMPRLYKNGIPFNASTHSEMLAEARVLGAGDIDKAIARTKSALEKETPPINGWRRSADTINGANSRSLQDPRDVGMQSRPTAHQAQPPAAADLAGTQYSAEADILEALHRIKEQGYRTGPGGSLLKQDLPDEVLPSLLQWDKPLKEQPKNIKDAMMKNPVLRDLLTNHENLRWNDVLGTGQFGSNEMTSKTLRQIGIPGLAYLDAGSRAGGKGTKNYVIWDQGLLDRMRPTPVE